MGGRNRGAEGGRACYTTGDHAVADHAVADRTADDHGADGREVVDRAGHAHTAPVQAVML